MECVIPLRHECNLRHVVSSTQFSSYAFLVGGFEDSNVILREIEVFDDFYLQKISFSMFVYHDM